MLEQLDGNNRWSIKFMSPEHNAALQQRQHQQAKATMPTKEELESIRDFVLLPEKVKPRVHILLENCITLVKPTYIT